MPLPSFCPSCAAEVEPLSASAGRCGGCERELYAHSHPTAGALIERGGERGGEILLVRRAVEPSIGKWDVPGGFLDDGELPEDGLRREVREELALELGAIRLLFADVNQLTGRNVLDLMFEAKAPTTAPTPGDDVSECAYFPLDDLPDDLAFPSTRRILDRYIALRVRHDYRLLGGAVVDPHELSAVAEIQAPFADLPDGWRVECGAWRIHDGALCAEVAGEQAAALWLKTPIPGDHMIAFEAYAVPPHRNDINCYWEGAGQILGNDETDDVACTIAGFGGWWDGLTGIERYPEGGARTTARLIPLEAGRTYEVVAGRLGPTDFLFIDGRLALQLDDPAHPRRQRSFVALSTWDSHVHFVRARAYRLT